MMNLYLCHNGIGDYYVVAPDPTTAQNNLEYVLNNGGMRQEGYGFTDDRKVKSIKLVAESISIDSKGHPYLTNKYLLLNGLVEMIQERLK
jgi:hypothetical protein